jgi:hypothetical protein
LNWREGTSAVRNFKLIDESHHLRDIIIQASPSFPDLVDLTQTAQSETDSAQMYDRTPEIQETMRLNVIVSLKKQSKSIMYLNGFGTF